MLEILGLLTIAISLVLIIGIYIYYRRIRESLDMEIFDNIRSRIIYSIATEKENDVLFESLDMVDFVIQNKPYFDIVKLNRYMNSLIKDIVKEECEVTKHHIKKDEEYMHEIATTLFAISKKRSLLLRIAMTKTGRTIMLFSKTPYIYKLVSEKRRERNNAALQLGEIHEKFGNDAVLAC